MAREVRREGERAWEVGSGPLPHRIRILWGLLLIQAGIYAAVCYLSARFDYNSPFVERPILLVLALLATCFGLHLLALRFGLQVDDKRAVVRIVMVGAIVFRVVLIPSTPIQEIDIYRYLWDGASVAQGVSPYRYSPEQVLQADETTPTPEDLRRLIGLRDGMPSLAEALQRIHYADLTTLYPMTSQAVFAMAFAFTPSGTSLFQRVLVLKGLVVCFDLATLFVLFALLKKTGRSPAWAILYGWSPLVLKEFANSGHFDSIAVFFSMAAIHFLIPRAGCPGEESRIVRSSLSGLFLGLATGAKLYPIVLLPLMMVITYKRGSWKGSLGFLFGCVLFAAHSVAPMALTSSISTEQAEIREFETPEIEFGESTSTHYGHSSGVTAFLSRWEMNDLPFLVLVENLRPGNPSVETSAPTLEPWFVIVPESWRLALGQTLVRGLGRDIESATFLAARLLTLVLFVIVAVAMAYGASRSNEPEDWLRCAFLTIAWFWALSPTMNPWYWTWALPLLPFARSRAWYAVSGLLLLYYLRFWVAYRFSDTALLGTPYEGGTFFHYVIAPVEHGIWMGWLLWEWVARRISLSWSKTAWWLESRIDSSRWDGLKSGERRPPRWNS